MTTNKINNCKSYKYNSANVRICHKCYDGFNGYALSIDSLSCISIIANCVSHDIISTTLSGCRYCADGYVVSINQKSCVKIDNCIYYYRNTTSNSITC